jgi:ornithine cyclodeaminase/alanine dehydrogenase-like protein (mu-crystallin family)
VSRGHSLPRAYPVTKRHSRQLAAEYPLWVSVAEGRYCNQAAAAVPDASIVFTCTRTRGHSGPHVAHVPDGTVAAWWDDEE